MSYDAFGVMKVLRPGDFNGDGVVNLNDWTEFNAAFVDPTLAALTCDIDVNGTVTGNDYDLFGQLWEESSATDADEVRLGYAGYVRDPVTGLLLARNRWYDANIGRWITRDPAGYVDGLSLYLYARGNPFGLVDPMGLGGEEPDKKENERTAAYQYKHRNSDYQQYGLDYEGGNDEKNGFSDAVDRKRGEIHRHLYNKSEFEGTIVFPMYDDAAAVNADRVVAKRGLFRTAGNIGTTLRLAGEAATAFNPITNAAMTVSNFAEDPSFSNAAGVALATIPVVGKVVQGAAKEADAAKSLSKVREGIYEFPDAHASGIPYVGQSGDLPTRLATHVRNGNLSPGTEAVTEVLGGKVAREMNEHQRIQQLTAGQKAKNSPAVANRKDPIGSSRRKLLGLQEPRD